MQCQQGMAPGSAKRIPGMCVVHILLSNPKRKCFSCLKLESFPASLEVGYRFTRCTVWLSFKRGVSRRSKITFNTPGTSKVLEVSFHLSAFLLTRLTSHSLRHWDAAHTVLSIVLSEPATAVRRTALASKWLLVPGGFCFVRTSLLSCLSY